MNRYTVLFDANVLYPFHMRDVLVQLAVTGLFRAKWTADIHREWVESLLRNEPQLERAKVEGVRDRMDEVTPDCLVSGYKPLIPSLDLPDADDRHILAAAITGRCNAIITQNLKDFPAQTLESFGIEARHPDDFLRDQLSLAPGPVCSAIQKIRARLKNPPKSATAYLATLTRLGLVVTATKLKQFSDLI